MSTQETTTAETAKPKKAKASKKTAKAKKDAKAKKVAKATKPKSTRSGSKAAIVLEPMKRKEGATLRKSQRPPTGRTTAFADSSAGT
jgi:hypothetical protein